jgi:hypothetical protein
LRVPTPAAASAPAPAEAHAPNPFTNSFARLVAETPSGRDAIAYDAAPLETHHIEEPRSEISLDWPLEPRRPWLKIIGGLAALALIAGGGWFVLSRYESTDATSKSAPVAKKPVPMVAAKSDTLLVKRDSAPAGPPASVVKPGVTSEIIPSHKPEATAAAPAAVTPSANADEGPPADAKHATHVAAKTATPATAEPDPDLIAAPAMPNIKVDAITNMIDDSARHRADSVSSAIQQKAPVFKPKAYKPPS